MFYIVTRASVALGLCVLYSYARECCTRSVFYMVTCASVALGLCVC